MISAVSLSILLALVLDWKCGELRRFHPLVGFGNIASRVEKTFNVKANEKWFGVVSGVAAWLLVTLPFVCLAYLLSGSLSGHVFWKGLIGAIFLYFAIGWQSLMIHAKAISDPLKRGELGLARDAVSMIVSRDTSDLNAEQVASAATESVLENGADALFAALFWFVVLGIPGVVLYRLSNTLDAMWGYKNERYLSFGWMAARMDDVLNLIPARLTALSYSLVGHRQLALASWRKQGGTWKSPNAGPVMAAGAGAINVSLGGGAIYHGQWQDRPSLGPKSGSKASEVSIEQSITLVNKALALWLTVIVTFGLFV